MTESEIQYHLMRGLSFHKDLVMTNCYYGQVEADVLRITDSGFFHEYEIKTSRSDFKADEKKIDKHLNLKAGNGHWPARFWYVCPDGVIEKDKLPTHAGLIWISEDGEWTRVKKAPILHREKFPDWKVDRLMVNFYHRHINKEFEYLKFKTGELQEMRKQAKEMTEHEREENNPEKEVE